VRASDLCSDNKLCIFFRGLANSTYKADAHSERSLIATHEELRVKKFRLLVENLKYFFLWLSKKRSKE
jgi:hypothetical protein